jgi:hypothetical protein
MDSMSYLRSLLVIVGSLACCLTTANDNILFSDGYPLLNSVGRYSGWGWSQHTFHSRVDGRLNIITDRHPACAYGSQALTGIYSPSYQNYPARPVVTSPTTNFWNAPIATDAQSKQHESPSISQPEYSLLDSRKKTAAPEQKNGTKKAPADTTLPPPTKPNQPPPSWLKRYLESESNERGEGIESESSPSDRTSGKPGVKRHHF